MTGDPLRNSYISIYRYSPNRGEPYQIYVEIDSGRREVRKVGAFSGGRGERVGTEYPNPDFTLASEPVVEFVGELSTDDAFLEEISGEWFEDLWEEAGTGSMKFIEDDSESAF